ncbi:MAG: tetratricopeptide repeat protein, partial [Thermoanaerobaculia bacterium]
LYEPHTPYDPPEPFKSRYPSKYDGEIATADDVAGRFLAFLKGNGLYDRSSIILLSDHGEGLGEHGEDEHGLLLYRESLQVPLIVKTPGSASRQATVETPAQLVDVFATAVQLAGINAQSAGTSLLELRDHPAQRRIFAETYFPRLHFGWSDLHSVIESNNHLIRGTRSELFDIVKDPAERQDLTTERRRDFSSLRTALDPQMGPIELTAQITPEEAKKLAALGYIGSSANSTSAELPDTRDQLDVFREVRQAWRYIDTGRYPEAIAASDKLLQRNSQMSDIWQLRATAFEEMGRTAEAMDAARRGLALNPTSEPLLIGMARLSLQVKDFERAGQYADLLLATRPLEAHDFRARVALANGDLERSAEEAKAALASGRDSADVYFTLGRIALARHDLSGGLQQFEKAQAVLDRTGDKMRNLNHDRGFVLAQLGRDADAEKAFREEIRLFPENAFAYKNLIVFYAVHGRVQDEARLVDTLITHYASPAAFAAVSDAMSSLGNRAAARKAAQDGLKRFPGDPQLIAALRNAG